MLKKTLFITCIGILLVSQNVQAGETAQTGALGGAAGGALLGQAIGRNTKGTLLGTAIGGVLGYMIGNEMEKDQGATMRVYSPPPRVVHQYQDEDDYPEVRVYERPVIYERPVVYERPVIYCRPAPVVRETVIIDRDYHPRYRGHGRGHWEESEYRPRHYGYR